MRVLGIDPGSRITGLGVVEARDDGLQSLFFESVKLKGDPLPARLGQIFSRVQQVIAEYQPDVVSIEQVFMAKNTKSALTLGHARGAAISAAVAANCLVSEYSALQIKRAVVGTGSAGKEQVQHMIRVLLGMRIEPPSDAADSLAAAICHIHTAQVELRMQKAAGE